MVEGRVLRQSIRVEGVQARALIVNGPVPSKHSPHPPVPRTPNNTVPTLQKCPLSGKRNHFLPWSLLETQFCGVCGSNAQLKSGSRGGVGPRAVRPTKFPAKSTWCESVICKNFRLRRARGEESGASPSAASQPLAEVSRAGKTGVDRAEKVSPR